MLPESGPGQVIGGIRDLKELSLKLIELDYRPVLIPP
jgi:hypothetical protein